MTDSHRPRKLVALRVPRLEVERAEMSVCLHLARRGDHVTPSDRVIEIVAGPAVVELSAPVTGRVVRFLVEEDEPIQPGQPLVIFHRKITEEA